MSLYNPCPCESGKKFKFCCAEALDKGDSADLESRIDKFPVFCFGGSEIAQTGLATIVVARRIGDDNYIAANYLVDVWCLGVKDADFKKNLTHSMLEALVHGAIREQGSIVSYSYEDTRSLILGSVAFAAQFGLAPHADWVRAKTLIEPDRAFVDKLTFGIKGKPHYVQGPYDDQRKQFEVISKIQRSGGTWALFS